MSRVERISIKTTLLIINFRLHQGKTHHSKNQAIYIATEFCIEKATNIAHTLFCLNEAEPSSITCQVSSKRGTSPLQLRVSSGYESH